MKNVTHTYGAIIKNILIMIFEIYFAFSGFNYSILCQISGVQSGDKVTADLSRAGAYSEAPNSANAGN